MTGPVNGRYVRRFVDWSDRPSNLAGHRFDEPTRVRVSEIAVWLDGQQLVAEAERAQRAEANRQDREHGWETSGQIRRGDPGE